jgi:patatin-like phospholipase/acyl hydrolase
MAANTAIESSSTSGEPSRDFRILSLDGGGAKGVYTLGILQEVEASANRPLHEVFQLIFGTSTGAIIASLLASGHRVSTILDLYSKHVPAIMKRWGRRKKSKALKEAADEFFADADFSCFRTGVGIVATNWNLTKPMIFKNSVAQAHGAKATFKPGFGCKVADAVVASCSAYPFFKRVRLQTENQGIVELGDGGYCANNPTVFAIVDALHALRIPRANVKVLSLGAGSYPQPRHKAWKWIVNKWPSVQLLQKTLSVNVTTMEQLQKLLFPDVSIVRINEAFTKPDLAMDFLEYRKRKLELLFVEGRQSFMNFETQIAALLGGSHAKT